LASNPDLSRNLKAIRLGEKGGKKGQERKEGFCKRTFNNLIFREKALCVRN
jgi:hypothetical protein